jgi:hypothetical protein
MGLTDDTRWYISPSATADALASENVDDGFVDIANMWDDDDATEGGGFISNAGIAARGAQFQLHGGHPAFAGQSALWAGCVVDYEITGVPGIDNRVEVRVRGQTEAPFSPVKSLNFLPGSRKLEVALFDPADRYSTDDAITIDLNARMFIGGSGAHDFKCYRVWFVAVPGRRATRMEG